MNKKGQALVEFILILPILVILLLGIIDFGLIFYKKNTLENNLEEVTTIWKETKNINEINEYLSKVDDNIEFNTDEEQKTTTIELSKNYNLITPGLNYILKNPYEIKVSRVIYNESE